jgi:hypothetical protein
MSGSRQSRAEWDSAVDGFLTDPVALEDAFLERWQTNAITLAPSGLPRAPEVARDHGWAVALEFYLIGFEVANKRSDLLRDAIIKAESKVDEMRRGEAWLEDILALRRLPPTSIAYNDAFGETIDWNALECMLVAARRIARDLPRPDMDSYLFLARLYQIMTNALVSEVVETNATGRVALEFAIGRRLMPVDARSLFRTFSETPDLDRRWGAFEVQFSDIQEAWRELIATLVDTLSLLNRDLSGLPDEYSLRMRPGRLKQLTEQRIFARQLDQSFYRLLKADMPGRETVSGGIVDDFAGALEVLSAIARPGRAPYGFYPAGTEVRRKLWGGEVPVSEEVFFNEAGRFCYEGAGG